MKLVFSFASLIAAALCVAVAAEPYHRDPHYDDHDEKDRDYEVYDNHHGVDRGTTTTSTNGQHQRVGRPQQRKNKPSAGSTTGRGAGRHPRATNPEMKRPRAGPRSGHGRPHGAPHPNPNATWNMTSAGRGGYEPWNVTEPFNQTHGGHNPWNEPRWNQSAAHQGGGDLPYWNSTVPRCNETSPSEPWNRTYEGHRNNTWYGPHGNQTAGGHGSHHHHHHPWSKNHSHQPHNGSHHGTGRHNSSWYGRNQTAGGSGNYHHQHWNRSHDGQGHHHGPHQGTAGHHGPQRDDGAHESHNGHGSHDHHNGDRVHDEDCDDDCDDDDDDDEHKGKACVVGVLLVGFIVATGFYVHRYRTRRAKAHAAEMQIVELQQQAQRAIADPPAASGGVAVPIGVPVGDDSAVVTVTTVKPEPPVVHH